MRWWGWTDLSEPLAGRCVGRAGLCNERCVVFYHYKRIVKTFPNRSLNRPRAGSLTPLQ